MAFYFHSMIADYYLGIWGGGIPKPFKYTEIQRHRFNLADKEGIADRKVPIQPLVFHSKDGKVTRYNLRKVLQRPFVFSNGQFIPISVWRVAIPFSALETL